MYKKITQKWTGCEHHLTDYVILEDEWFYFNYEWWQTPYFYYYPIVPYMPKPCNLIKILKVIELENIS